MSLAQLVGKLSQEDYAFVHGCLGSVDRINHPDLIIAPDGEPYIYRWWLIPRGEPANVYLHIQVQDDPERPLHDHPWDNQSVIVSGGYRERYVPYRANWAQHHGYDGRQEPRERVLRKGDVMTRKAEEAHRIFLLDGVPYTITIFSTGPVRRDWGFWLDRGWVDSREVLEMTPDGRSIFMEPKEEPAHV